MRERQEHGTSGGERDLIDHPAIRAWHQLGADRCKADRIQVLGGQRKRGRCVYRLAGVGPGKCNVVAKHCEYDAGAAELRIYREMLTRLPIDALQCYGMVEDQSSSGFCWLFLEDAGDEEYSSDLIAHRTLAGRWLGAMHVSASQLYSVASLPDRGANFELEMLRLGRRMTNERIGHSAFEPEQAEMLKSVVAQCDALERHWDVVERFCERMPRTLVHGDFVSKNLRVRNSRAGVSLMVMDWEKAGFGIPAADLAEFGKASNPDLAAYRAVLQTSWPHLDLPDLRRLARLGNVFRLINAIAWTNRGFKAESAQWYAAFMGYYERGLTEYARALG